MNVTVSVVVFDIIFKDIDNICIWDHILGRPHGPCAVSQDFLIRVHQR